MAQIHPVPPEFAARARITADDYEKQYAESVKDPEGFWSRVGQRLDWIKPYTKVKDVSYDAKDLHIRWYHDGELNVSANCLDRHLEKRGDKTAIMWEGDDPKESKAHHVQTTARTGVQSRQRAEKPRRGEGRSHHDLHADDSGSRHRDARVRAHRRGAFRRVRRLFARFAGRTHLRFVVESRHHRRRGVARRQESAAESKRRRGIESAGHVERRDRTGRKAHRFADSDASAARSLVGRTDGGASADCAPTPVEAEHPLFILYTSGSTGKPKGVLHTTGGYSRVREFYARMRVRSARRRCLLVHGRRRLGHRTQLYRVRTARQRRDVADVRRRAELSGFRPFLAGRSTSTK